MGELSCRLKKLREDKGVSMDKMCSDLYNVYGVNLAKSTISKWENGKMEPTLSYAKLLSQYFNVTLDYITGFSEKEKIKVSSNGLETVAAHFDGENFSEEDKEDIENFIRFVLSKKKK